MGRVKVQKIVLSSYGSYLGIEKGCLVVRNKSGRASKYPMRARGLSWFKLKGVIKKTNIGRR